MRDRLRKCLTWLPFSWLLILAAAAALIICLDGCYLMHVAKGQLDVARRSISVEEALRSDDLSPADKDRLRLVQEIRAFSESELGLSRSQNYTKYYPGPKKPLTYVVTAARRDRLEPVTWWFPVVGRVAYKGFFDLDKAKRERDSLAADGYDTYLRPALAYSTLGWFTDPILPLMLDLDDGELAGLIIHELAHGTVYVSSHSDFNESFAEFVGRQGAVEYLALKYGSGDVRVARLQDRFHDEQLFDEFIRRAAARLRTFYASAPKDLEAARQREFAAIRAEFEEWRPRFRTDGYSGLELRTVNNAMIMANLTYGDTVPFEEAVAYCQGNWTEFLKLVREAAQSDKPLQRLRELTPQ